MKNKELFRLIYTMLAGVLILTDCTFTPIEVDYSYLEAVIAEAEMENDATTVSANGRNMPLGTYWVTTTEKADFTSAIKSAKTALSSISQSEVDIATRTLASKLEEFMNVRQPGIVDPVDKIALYVKIAEAELEKSSVVIALYVADVAQNRKWVIQSVMDDFNSAIHAAKEALTRPAQTQTNINTAVNALSMALNTFITAQRSGIKSTGFTQEDLDDLINEAKTAKNDIKTGTSEDDVGPAEYWVSKSSLTAFNNAIDAAQNADEDIDGAYLALVSAMNTFKTDKSFGSMPNKSALFNAIRAAITAKIGVVAAANAAQAPYGSKWATQQQLALLNINYTNAMDAVNNINATKNQVTALTSALVTATSGFNSAVAANGPGSKKNSITINGLYIYNGKEITVGLFASGDNIDQNPEVYGNGIIRNGAVTITLKNSLDDKFWLGNGLWYVRLTIDAEIFISKSAVNFTNNSNPVTAFSDYKEYGTGNGNGNGAGTGNGTELSPFQLTASAWANGSITSNAYDSEVWYSFNVLSGTTYYVWWNDSDDGNGTKTLDIKVDVYNSDGLFYFWKDNGWGTPNPITAVSTGAIKLCVYPYSHGETGTFAIAYSTNSLRPGN